MCGIVGLIAPSGVDRPVLSRMSGMLVHRGPDGFGTALWRPGRDLELAHGHEPEPGAGDHVGLAHRRLAIIAPGPAAAQPFRIGETALAFNGEIYNHAELRAELERLGHAFATRSDTEVALRAWLQWGAEAFGRFSGMWALAILDAASGRVVLSRDRFGIKPLYWAPVSGGIAFASEIKALLAHPEVARDPDPATLARFVAEGVSDEGEHTFFAGIRAFPAASWAEVAAGRPEVAPRRFWSPPEPARQLPGDAAGQLAELLDRSIGLHLESDVPVGTCLSGGVDSSAIVCLASRRPNAQRWTGIGYVPDDPRFQETRWMRAVAERTGARLDTVTAGPDDVLAALPAILAAQDEPFGSLSIAAQYFVFRRARELGLTVMLDGQGADELFAGYPAYRHVLARQHMRSLAWGRALAMAREAGDLPARSLVAGALLPEGLHRRLGAAGRMLERVAPGLAGHSRAHPSGERRHLGRMLRAELTRTRLPALLRFEDRNSMAHSVEARVPFLDHHLVEFALSLPPESNLAEGTTKAVLRRALAGSVPDEVLNRRDKIGFTPDPGWVAAVIAAWGADMAANRSRWEREWFSEPAVAGLLANAARAPAQAGAAAWRVLNAKAWLRAQQGEGAP